MADTASFTVTLDDQFSQPAQKIGASAGNAGQQLQDMGSFAQSGLMGAVAGGNLLAGGLEKVAEFATRAAEEVIHLGVEGARALGEAVVSATLFSERMMTAFTTLTKGGVDGGAELVKIANLAADLGLPVQQTADSFRRLLAMQFAPQAAEDLIRMSADLQTVGVRAEETGRILLAMSQIKAKGRLQSEELLQMAEAGLNTGNVLDALASKLGKTRAEVQKLMQAGKITADEGIAAIEESIKKGLGESKLGEAGAKAAMSTLGGMLGVLQGKASAKLIEIGERLVKPMEKIFLPIGRDIIAALDSPEAKAVMDGVVAGFMKLGDAVRVAWPIVKEFATGFLGGFKKGWAELSPIVEKLGVNLKSIDWATVAAGAGAVAEVLGSMVAIGAAVVAVGAELFGPIIQGAIMVIDAFTWLKDNIDTIGGELVDTMGTIGDDASAALIDGLVGGITGGIPSVHAAMTGLGDGGYETLQKLWQAHSPSRKFEELGFDATAGLAGGIEAGTADVVSVSARMGSAALGGFGGGGGRGGLGGVTVNFTNTVNGAGKNAEAIVTEIERSFQSKMAAFFDQLAAEHA